MRGQITRLAKVGIIYGLGNVLNKFLSFLLMPLFTRYLQPEDYGVMALLAVLNIALSGIFTLGTGCSLGICYFETPNCADRKEIVWTNFVLLLFISIILLALCTFFASGISSLLLQNKNKNDLVMLSLAGLAISVVTIPLHSYMRMEEKAKTFVVVTIFSTIMIIGLNIYEVVYLGKGIRGMLESSLIGSGIALCINFIIVVSSLRISINLKWIPKLVKIGYPSILGVGAFFVIDWMNRLLLQRLAGIDEVGIYSIGYSFGAIMVLLAEGAFGSAWAPYFISFINKRDETKNLFGHIFKYYIFAYGTLSMFFFMLAQPAVVLMTAPPFHGAYTIVGLIACSCVLKVCYLILLPGFFYEKRLGLQTFIEWCAAIISICLNFVLIPLWHKEGAALAMLLSYLSLPFMAYFIGKKFIKIDYDWNSIVKYSIIFVIIAALSYINITQSVWSNSGFRLILIAIFGIMIYKLVLTFKEKKLINNFIVALKSKIPGCT